MAQGTQAVNQDTRTVGRWTLGWLVVAGIVSPGCALHYYEEATGTEHIWGIGHMAMTIPQRNEGLQVVIHGTDVVGGSIGRVHDHGYLTLGWQRMEFIDILQESVSVCVEWPNGSFHNVRVGSRFPYTKDTPTCQSAGGHLQPVFPKRKE
ncbi:hypothetical protein [Nitrospira sp. BLG_2]|uniref:hypothetical protein n=1 Tax=Nitrospira sp. BLG_2 TaxID=3397507 RepID=UPI003B9C8D55